MRAGKPTFPRVGVEPATRGNKHHTFFSSQICVGGLSCRIRFARGIYQKHTKGHTLRVIVKKPGYYPSIVIKEMRSADGSS